MISNQIVTEGGNLPVLPWTGSEGMSGNSIDLDPRLELSDQALVLASHNGFPIVAQQRARRDNMGIAAGAGIALVLGVATFVSLSSSRTPQTSPTGSPLIEAPQANAQMPAATPMGGVPMPGPAAQPDSILFEDPTANPGLINVQSMPSGPSPVVVWDTGNMPVGAGASPEGKAGAGSTPGMLAGISTFQGLTTSDAAAARSTQMADPANTVAQGTLIPAVLETAINSDLPGYVRAVVSQDVRSFDGSRILVPRSSRLIGEYKTGLAAGQKRAYLLWTRLLRPDGVSVALASPAVDSSGQSGVEGKVNNHFFQRFGSAILLSIVGGASTIASGGSTVVVSGGQTAASAAIQRDGDRPPTIRVRQGQPLRVFTARDLIFSGEGGRG